MEAYIFQLKIKKMNFKKTDPCNVVSSVFLKIKTTLGEKSLCLRTYGLARFHGRVAIGP